MPASPGEAAPEALQPEGHHGRNRRLYACDRRFDGRFVAADLGTGVYCRPGFPALSPQPERVRRYPTSAAAQLAGFRACRRCPADAVPGAPESAWRRDLVGRTLRLISDRLVEREGVAGLCRRLGVEAAHLEGLLVAAAGDGAAASPESKGL